MREYIVPETYSVAQEQQKIIIQWVKGQQKEKTPLTHEGAIDIVDEKIKSVGNNLKRIISYKPKDDDHQNNRKYKKRNDIHTSINNRGNELKGIREELNPHIGYRDISNGNQYTSFDSFKKDNNIDTTNEEILNAVKKTSFDTFGILSIKPQIYGRDYDAHINHDPEIGFIFCEKDSLGKDKELGVLYYLIKISIGGKEMEFPIHARERSQDEIYGNTHRNNSGNYPYISTHITHKRKSTPLLETKIINNKIDEILHKYSTIAKNIVKILSAPILGKKSKGIYTGIPQKIR